MSFQLLIQSPNVQAVELAIPTPFKAALEVFAVSEGLIGLSIPSQALIHGAEEIILKNLVMMNVYDLYSGQWRYSK
jgi:hypothetical protein